MVLLSINIIQIPIKSYFPYQSEGNVKDSEILDANKNEIRKSESLFNDSVPPLITWDHPSKNNSIIKKKSYDFIVTIIDDNPPTSGNVTIEISNSSVFLFSAMMIYEDENYWFFNWENISSYPNYVTYIIKVLAKDSSINENYNYSKPLYILLSYSTSPYPDLLSGIIYISIVIVIFALILVYFRKKSSFLKTIEQA